MTRLQRIRNWLRSDMLVLRWVFLTLYVLILLGLSWPFMAENSGESFLSWIIVCAILFGSQALFLFGGGTMRLCRPIRKQRLWMPVFVAATMLTLGLAATGLAVFEAVFGDRSPPFEGLEILFILGLVANWVFWMFVLWNHVANKPRIAALSRITAIVFAGSLLELIACVPSHIIASRRQYCLAGLTTMLGLIAAIFIMLFSFGPAIVLLFLRPRHRRERLEQLHLCLKCDYDLRGTLAAGRTSCPECGARITMDQIKSLPGVPHVETECR